jgi:hypothetical protein
MNVHVQYLLVQYHGEDSGINFRCYFQIDELFMQSNKLKQTGFLLDKNKTKRK